VSFAKDVNMIYAGRAITGFCIGIISLSLPVYLAETIQADVRGTLGMLPTTLGNLGMLICYVCGAWLDWSQLAMISVLLPIPFLIMMLTIPETPRFLISKGKEQDAKAALKWLCEDLTQVEDEYQAIKKSQDNGVRFIESGCLRKQDLRPLSICIGLHLFQQFSGINAVMFYSVSIFKDSGSSSPHLSTITLGVVNLFSTMSSNLLVDKVDRKILLYTSAIGMMLSLGILSSHYYLLSYTETFPYTPLIALVIYISSFSIGFGPIPWLLIGEILPSRSRGFCASITTSFHWASTFLVTKSFLDLRNLLGPAGVFCLFGSVCCLAIIFVQFCVPETRGVSLEDIEAFFNSTLIKCPENEKKDRNITSMKISTSKLLSSK